MSEEKKEEEEKWEEWHCPVCHTRWPWKNFGLCDCCDWMDELE